MKTCPKCSTKCGVRTLKCPKDDCDHEFSKSKKKEKVIAPPPTNDGNLSSGRGKKTCPEENCGKVVGIRTQICPFCKHKFQQKVIEEPKLDRPDKVRKVVKKLDIPSDKDIITPKGINLEEVTPKEHAHRVLGYGEKRARALLHMHQKTKCWGHVDWNYVEEELGILVC